MKKAHTSLSEIKESCAFKIRGGASEWNDVAELWCGRIFRYRSESFFQRFLLIETWQVQRRSFETMSLRQSNPDEKSERIHLQRPLLRPQCLNPSCAQVHVEHDGVFWNAILFQSKIWLRWVLDWQGHSTYIWTFLFLQESWKPAKV